MSPHEFQKGVWRLSRQWNVRQRRHQEHRSLSLQPGGPGVRRKGDIPSQQGLVNMSMMHTCHVHTCGYKSLCAPHLSSFRVSIVGLYFVVCFFRTSISPPPPLVNTMKHQSLNHVSVSWAQYWPSLSPQPAPAGCTLTSVACWLCWATGCKTWVPQQETAVLPPGIMAPFELLLMM